MEVKLDGDGWGWNSHSRGWVGMGLIPIPVQTFTLDTAFTHEISGKDPSPQENASRRQFKKFIAFY
jgi:hypothetical protein